MMPRWIVTTPHGATFGIEATRDFALFLRGRGWLVLPA